MRHYKIGFTKQWDKIKPERFAVGTHITTFRAYIPWLVKNYKKMLDDKAEAVVLLNKQPIGRARLDSMHFEWSDKVTLDFIRKDTFMRWGWHDWEQYLEKTYGLYPIFGEVLYMTLTSVKSDDLKQTKIVL